MTSDVKMPGRAARSAKKVWCNWCNQHKDARRFDRHERKCRESVLSAMERRAAERSARRRRANVAAHDGIMPG